MMPVEGAGIPAADLQQRIVWSTEKDLRYYMMQRIREMKKISPQPLGLWKLIPEGWVEQARKRDERLLTGNEKPR